MRHIACALTMAVIMSTAALLAEEPASDEPEGIPAIWFYERSLKEAIERTADLTGRPIEIAEGVSVEGTIQLLCPEKLTDPLCVIPREGVETTLDVVLRAFGLALCGFTTDSGERIVRPIDKHEQHVTALCFLRHASPRAVFGDIQFLLHNAGNVRVIPGTNMIAVSGGRLEMLRALGLCESVDFHSRPLDIEVEVYSVDLDALQRSGSAAPWECAAEGLRKTLVSGEAGASRLYSWKGCVAREHGRQDGWLVSFDVGADGLDGGVKVELTSQLHGVDAIPGPAPGLRDAVTLRPNETLGWRAEVRLERWFQDAKGALTRTTNTSAERGAWATASFRSGRVDAPEDVLVWFMRVTERK